VSSMMDLRLWIWKFNDTAFEIEEPRLRLNSISLQLDFYRFYIR
jgi:hypothetical protein